MTRMKQPLPEWSPQQPPVYDIDKTYLENADTGPFFFGKYPDRQWPDKQLWYDFLGFQIASPIGIPAGPLLNSRWIGMAAGMGFDIVAYKTIRSHEHQSHPLPNVMLVDTNGPLIPNKLPPFLKTAANPTIDLNRLGITNSFGNPSRTPAYLMQDIPKANGLLKPGQIMIVSVFGSQREGIDMLQDFINAATLAKNAGAKVIEANYSCPNVAAGEGSLYASPDSVLTFTSRLAKAIHPIPLIIKVGAFTSEEQMRKTFIAAARGGARAICGLNTISMNVFDQKGNPALGPKRPTSGICGSPIRQAALQFTRQARDIIDEEKLGMALLVTGGVTLWHHFRELLVAGADIAMTATGMMWDPYLAMRYHNQTFTDKLTTEPQRSMK